MLITGTIQKILPTETQIGKDGKSYSNRLILLEYNDRNVARVAAFKFFGNATEWLNNYNVLDSVIIDFSPNTREWNGKYFTELNAYRIIKH